MCTNVHFPIYIRSYFAHLLPCPKGVKPSIKSGIIRERYWILNLAPTCGQLMSSHPRTSKYQPNKKNPTCLEYEVFLCYFGPHGSGHHPSGVDTFHPRRLPHSGTQTLPEYQVMTHFRLHELLRVKDPILNLTYFKRPHVNSCKHILPSSLEPQIKNQRKHESQEAD